MTKTRYNRITTPLIVLGIVCALLFDYVTASWLKIALIGIATAAAIALTCCYFSLRLSEDEKNDVDS